MVISQKTNIARGGQEMARAALLALGTAAAKGPFDHYVFLSGTDLLLRTPRSLYSALWVHHGLTLLPIGGVEWLDDFRLPQASTFHKENRSGRMPRRLAFECGGNAFGLPELAHEVGLPVGLLHSNGAQWAALSPAFALEVLRAARHPGAEVPRRKDSAQEARQSAKLTWLFDYADAMQQPDERLLQTLLLNSKEQFWHVGFNLHHVNGFGAAAVRSPNSDFDILSPEPFSVNDWESELSVSSLMEQRPQPQSSHPFGAATMALSHFGRKFDDSKAGSILGARLLKQAASLSVPRWIQGDPQQYLGLLPLLCSRVLPHASQQSSSTTMLGLGRCQLEDLQVRMTPDDTIYGTGVLRFSIVGEPCHASLKTKQAVRSCQVRGQACLEELVAVARPPLPMLSDDVAAAQLHPGIFRPSSLPPRLLAVRVGVGWDLLKHRFQGPVSVFPATAAKNLTLVLYFAPSAWHKEVQVKWQMQTGFGRPGDCGWHSNTTTRAMVSVTVPAYAPLVATNFPRASMAPGVWSVSVRLSAGSRRAERLHASLVGCVHGPRPLRRPRRRGFGRFGRCGQATWLRRSFVAWRLEQSGAECILAVQDHKELQHAVSRYYTQVPCPSFKG
ncbi:unnamed protein product [Polarella glacialis]|uniref:Uncharacterized protein n=1 Tax=Polarella glacialis TaxID=89957 RepID=A0A813LMZ8_POLGL|nr:unnamed protein product [Polarella glacialis]